MSVAHRKFQNQIDSQIELLERALRLLEIDLDELERDLYFFLDSTPAYLEIREEHKVLAKEVELIRSRISILRFKRNLFSSEES